MTDNFNTQLLGILNQTIGIKIKLQNYLWGNRNNMARCNIRINIDFTPQRVHYVKSVLNEMLSVNLDQKFIVYTNTVSILEQM